MNPEAMPMPWRERVGDLERALSWARIVGARCIVHILSGNAEGAFQTARTAAGFAQEALVLESGTYESLV